MLHTLIKISFGIFWVFQCSAQINCNNSNTLSQSQISELRANLHSFIESNDDTLLLVSKNIYCHALKIEDDALRAYALNYLGLYSYNIEDQIQALKYLHEANDIIESLQITNDIQVQNFNFLGLVYHNLGQNSTALDYSLAFYNKAETDELEDEIYHASNMLGLIYRDIGEHEIAIKYLNKAKEGMKNLGNEYGYGYSILNLSIIANSNDDMPTAQYYLNEVINLWEQIEYEQGLYWAYLTAGGYFLHVDDQKVLNYLNKLEPIVQKLKKSNPVDYLKLNADYLYSVEDFDEAKKMYTEVLKALEYQQNFSVYKSSLQTMNEIYFKEQNYLEIMNLGNKVVEDLNLFNEREKTAILQLANNRNEHFMTVKNLQIERLRNERQSYLTAALIVSALLLTMFLYNLFQRNRNLYDSNNQLNLMNSQIEDRNIKIQIKNDTITKQNEMLESFVDKKVLLLSHHQDIMSSIRKELKNIPEKSQPIKNIEKIIRSSSQDNMWNNLDYFLDHNNRSFTKILLSHHPNLTNKEIQLATLLKLNLNTKEIANLLFLNPSSIKVARSRLRKKLNISDQKESLFKFLNQYT